MSTKQIESYIHDRDKQALYRSHMQKEINDDELLDAIIKIDDSVKSNKTDWLEIIHDIFFPSLRP